MADQLAQAALEYHRYPTPGKIALNPPAMAIRRVAMVFAPSCFQAASTDRMEALAPQDVRR